jgi:PII-like signaling protein
MLMRCRRRAAARFGSFVVACSLLPRSSDARPLLRQTPPAGEAALTIDRAVREAIEHKLTIVGMMGFGHHIHLHHKAFFGIADDRPVTSTVVDDKARLRAAVADIRPIVRAGVMVLIDVELIADAQRAS